MSKPAASASSVAVGDVGKNVCSFPRGLRKEGIQENQEDTGGADGTRTRKTRPDISQLRRRRRGRPLRSPSIPGFATSAWYPDFARDELRARCGRHRSPHRICRLLGTTTSMQPSSGSPDLTTARLTSGGRSDRLERLSRCPDLPSQRVWWVDVSDRALQFDATSCADLGDWRDRLTFPKPIFHDITARTDFYLERGFNSNPYGLSCARIR